MITRVTLTQRRRKELIVEERTWAVIMTVALYSNGMTGLKERIASLGPGPRATTRLRKVVILFASVGIFSVFHARVR